MPTPRHKAHQRLLRLLPRTRLLRADEARHRYPALQASGHPKRPTKHQDPLPQALLRNGTPCRRSRPQDSLRAAWPREWKHNAAVLCGLAGRSGPSRGRQYLVHHSIPDPLRRAPRTPYEHVLAELREAIETGEYQVGSLLPSNETIRARYRISTGTVSRAIAALKEAGMIEGPRGKRPRVIATAPQQTGASTPAAAAAPTTWDARHKL
jgi:DNA-binding transcriptional regulator YhcF (GntR family)